jgi:hypothetical protein
LIGAALLCIIGLQTFVLFRAPAMSGSQTLNTCYCKLGIFVSFSCSHSSLVTLGLVHPGHCGRNTAHTMLSDRVLSHVRPTCLPVPIVFVVIHHLCIFVLFELLTFKFTFSHLQAGVSVLID